MISLLEDAHKGKSVSVIGSGPSATLYDESTDISIGVNGAALLGKHLDYFLCGDHNAYKHEWFIKKCATTRIIARLVASLDYQLYPEEFDGVITRQSVKMGEGKGKGLQELPCPIYPHLIYNYRYYAPGRLKKNNNMLLAGGTISCCAVQLAYIMGCSELHLYGCNFKHKRNSHYFYESNQQPGRVYKSMIETMELCLKEIRGFGVKVYIHGESSLTECDKRVNVNGK